LEKVLGKKMALPKRRINSLDELFELFQGAKDIFIDRTESPIQRSKDKEKQKESYSGKKKPRGKELTDEEKARNKLISSIRVRVEHAIGGIKRMRITTDKFRNKKESFNVKAMLISCGLWNYHLMCR
jgi:CxxC motif-containing protein